MQRLRNYSILAVLFPLALLLFVSGCVHRVPGSAPEKGFQGGEKKMEGRVLFIIAPENFRDEELLVTKQTLESLGYETEVVSTEKGVATGMLGAEVEVKKTIDEINLLDYDALVLVGGIGAKIFFDDERVHEIFQKAYENGRVVAAICISPVTLAKAGLLKKKNATVWSSEAGTIKSYGAKYTGSDVEVDGRIVTASKPEAAKEFGNAIARAIERARGQEE